MRMIHISRCLDIDFASLVVEYAANNAVVTLNTPTKGKTSSFLSGYAS